MCALCALAGCATPPPPPPAPPDESRALLERAIGRSAILPTETASADAKPARAVMGGQSVSISFAGEAKDLLRRFSAARSLSFKVRGPQPYLPLFVIVEAKNVSVDEFLTDVGAQFGQRADLAITNETIEVRYRD